MRDWGASVAQRIALRFQVLRCIVFAVVAGLLASSLPVLSGNQCSITRSA